MPAAPPMRLGAPGLRWPIPRMEHRLCFSWMVSTDGMRITILTDTQPALMSLFETPGTSDACGLQKLGMARGETEYKNTSDIKRSFIPKGVRNERGRERERMMTARSRALGLMSSRLDN